MPTLSAGNRRIATISALSESATEAIFKSMLPMRTPPTRNLTNISAASRVQGTTFHAAKNASRPR